MCKIKIPVLRAVKHENMNNVLYTRDNYYVKECSSIVEEYREYLEYIIGKEKYICTIEKVLDENTNSTFTYVYFTLTEEEMLYLKMVSIDLFEIVTY